MLGAAVAQIVSPNAGRVWVECIETFLPMEIDLFLFVFFWNKSNQTVTLSGVKISGFGGKSVRTLLPPNPGYTTAEVMNHHLSWRCRLIDN